MSSLEKALDTLSQLGGVTRLLDDIVGAAGGFQGGTTLEQFYGPDEMDLSSMSEDEAMGAVKQRLEYIYGRIGEVIGSDNSTISSL